MPPRKDVVDVAIVGAGIVGCAAARRLAARGARVSVFDGRSPGGGATRASAGLLTVQATWPLPPLVEISLAAREAWPGLVDELEASTGLRTGYRTGGTLAVALDPDANLEGDERESPAEPDRSSRLDPLERLEMMEERSRAAGLRFERLTGSGLRRLEPALTASARLGLSFPDDRHVDSVRLIEALAASARSLGARFASGGHVEAVETGGGRVTAVRVGDRAVEARAVLIAAGCWSGTIAGLPDLEGVVPVRGQMLVLRGGPGVPGRAVIHGDRYVVPRGDGRILAGSTVERVGFEETVTAEALGGLRAHATRLLPALDGAPEAGSWAGLRPGTADGLPILGPSSVPGLVYATGLYRSGILLGPTVGAIAADLILEGTSPVPLDAFHPARFSRGGSAASP